MGLGGAVSLVWMSTQREFDVVIVAEPEGGYSVFVPELPSVATQGETIEEARANAQEATIAERTAPPSQPSHGARVASKRMARGESVRAESSALPRTTSTQPTNTRLSGVGGSTSSSRSPLPGLKSPA